MLRQKYIFVTDILCENGIMAEVWFCSKTAVSADVPDLFWLDVLHLFVHILCQRQLPSPVLGR